MKSSTFSLKPKKKSQPHRLMPDTVAYHCCLPQGRIISPTISNMVLDGLEKAVRCAVPRRCRIYFGKSSISILQKPNCTAACSKTASRWFFMTMDMGMSAKTASRKFFHDYEYESNEKREVALITEGYFDYLAR